MSYARADRDRVIRTLHQRQSGRCVVCRLRGVVVRGGGLVLDHCHRTGRPRAILCTGCNSALGMARENPTILRALAVYAQACNAHAEAHEGEPVALRPAPAPPISPYTEGLLTPAQKEAVYKRVLSDPSLRGRI